jgi:hypothetical protein
MGRKEFLLLCIFLGSTIAVYIVHGLFIVAVTILENMAPNCRKVSE